MIAPVFSHGGSDEPGYVAVAGSGVSKGRPVSSLSASQDGHVMNLVLTGTAGQTKTVKLEGHGGSVDQAGFPVESDWIDYSGGGYVMVVGGGNAPTTLSKKLPRGVPYWRTNITAAPDASVLTSYCPGVIGPAGFLTKAQRPNIGTPAQVTTQ